MTLVPQWHVGLGARYIVALVDLITQFIHQFIHSNFALIEIKSSTYIVVILQGIIKVLQTWTSS